MWIAPATLGFFCGPPQQAAALRMSINILQHLPVEETENLLAEQLLPFISNFLAWHPNRFQAPLHHCALSLITNDQQLEKDHLRKVRFIFHC